MNKLKIVIKEVNKQAETVEIEDSIVEFQKIVGGFIEVLHFSDDILMILNEEGKLKGLPLNFILENEIYEEQIVGNVFFASKNGVEIDSLSTKQIEILKDMGIFDLE